MAAKQHVLRAPKELYSAAKLSDTFLKRLLLVLVVLSTCVSVFRFVRMGVPVVYVTLLAALSIVSLWFALYRITCLRDGGCHTLSVLIAVAHVVQILLILSMQ